MNEKEVVAKLLEQHIESISREEIIALLEKPKYSNLGDIAFPCFILAKLNKKSPFEIAQDIAARMDLLPKQVSKVEAIGGYINFYLNKQVIAENTIDMILRQKDAYGSSSEGKGKKIVIDFSSPNIAKPMSIGHLRSTIIGNSLSRIYSFLGYRCININFLGDYGTQFGKLIVAYKKWGKLVAKELVSEPVKALLTLYTKFHEEAGKENSDLEEEARKEFKKLEEGDKENLRLWKDFRAASIKEFEKFYDVLGVKFDSYSGESFYKDSAAKVIDELVKRKIAVESQGALIVNLDKFNLPPMLIKKSDGTTLYSSRDLAAAIARYNSYKFDKMLYVVASEQNTYFKQLFKTLELLGLSWARSCNHVNFGMIYMDKGKISTRKGSIIFLEDVLEKIFGLTRKMIKKDMPEKEKEKIAKAVGVSALIYSDLSNDRIRDIKFDWSRILQLEGDSGPYLQYTYARAKSILKRAGAKPKRANIKSDLLLSDDEKALVMLLREFPEIVKDAANQFAPHIIANYALKVADEFNRFYEKYPVLNASKDERQSRLALTEAVSHVLKNSFLLLGMIPLEKM